MLAGGNKFITYLQLRKVGFTQLYRTLPEKTGAHDRKIQFTHVRHSIRKTALRCWSGVKYDDTVHKM